MPALELLAPVIVTVTLILMIGAVILLRPLSKQGAALLEQMLKDRREGRAAEDMERLTSAMANLSERMRLLEDRQSFTESLIEASPESRGRIAEHVGMASSEE
jgi:flagellar biosynthesis/type III secretory pathway M-ring protein FliF/YscJ